MSRSATETMMAADMDVGPARPVEQERPQRAPASRLARLLLHSRHELCLLVLLLSSSMSACIIPVGPEFHEPLGNPNSPPIITAARPLEGSYQSDPRFHVVVTDNDLGDTLYVRWIVDYPPFPGFNPIVNETSYGPSEDGRPATPDVSWTFECLGLLAEPAHRVMAVVADRPFLTPLDPTDLTLTKPGAGGYSVAVPWTWLTNCELP